MERFPRLHAQLIEVVSELLRERLGPTSEYTQSLIEIQSAYINTNHPAFISGSAAAAQAASAPPPKPSIAPPRPASAEPMNGIAGPDDEEDASIDDNLLNGMARSADRERPRTTTPTPTISKSRAHGQRHTSGQSAAGYSVGSGSSAGSSMGAGAGIQPGTSPHSAKETFLNYFFGQNGPGPIVGPGGPGQQDSGRGHGHTANHPVPIGRDISNAYSSGPSGLMAGKRNLDGSNAAYDMRSLGKHIEAIPSTEGGSELTLREEMETSLIRSLITSYFAIVRQSIQDLVPKAIMHLLVNHSCQQVQNRLVATLYKPELFGDLLNEDEALVAERERVKALLDAYKEAFKTLSDVNLKPT